MNGRLVAWILTVPASPICTHELGCWGLMTESNWAMGRVMAQSKSALLIPHTPDWIHHGWILDVTRMRSIRRGRVPVSPTGAPGTGEEALR